MTFSTAEPASFDLDTPFLARHPRARRGFLGWVGFRTAPPRVVPRHLHEPVLGLSRSLDAEPHLEPALKFDRFVDSEGVELEDIAEPVLPLPVEAKTPAEIASLPVEPLHFEPPVAFEPIQITGIELPPAEIVVEAAPVEPPPVPALRAADLPVEGAVTEPAAAAIAAVAASPRRHSWTRRIVGGLLSAAAYVMASLMLLAAGPVYLLMSDSRDVVRWSNDLLDLVVRW